MGAFPRLAFRAASVHLLVMAEVTMRQAPENRPLPKRDAVEVWLFDLDNTLYPAACNLFPQVERRMGEFICKHFDLKLPEAKALQKRLFHEHGTTLRGLMSEHGIDAREFLDFVHDVDLSVIRHSPELDEALDRLPGRKLIFTNADEPYSERVLERMGIAHHFEGIFDIVASDYLPKPQPEPYDKLIKRFGIDPTKTIFFEDSARNLEPAHDRGMMTVWIEHDAPWSRSGVEEEGGLPHWVHHHDRDLLKWLQKLPE